MSEHQDKEKVAAVVVGFFPDFKILDRLLLKLLKQVDYLIFVDNGGGESFLANVPLEKSKVEYVNLNGNKGLGFALNEGFQLAVQRGCKYVATFDQDSDPPDSMIENLLDAHVRLESQRINCAAVAPVFYDYREGEKIRFPLYREKDGVIQALSIDTERTLGLIEVDVLITSGMLVRADVWSQGIQYNSDLFVDYTDTDWCFRTRDAGFRLYASISQEMGHALSEAPPARLFGLNFFRYSPLRRYYYFRNTIFFIRQKYVSFAWKKRLLTGLFPRFFVNLLIDEKKLTSLRMMSIGIWNGLFDKMGAFK